jgi:hypothetical protein
MLACSGLLPKIASTGWIPRGSASGATSDNGRVFSGGAMERPGAEVVARCCCERSLTCANGDLRTTATSFLDSTLNRPELERGSGSG